MSYYLSILPSVFVNGIFCAFITKTKSNLSQGPKTTFLNVLHSCIMFRYQWEVRCMRLKTSTLKPRHIICQLGSGLDNIDGAKILFLKLTFRISKTQVKIRRKLHICYTYVHKTNLLYVYIYVTKISTYIYNKLDIFIISCIVWVLEKKLSRESSHYLSVHIIFVNFQ